MNFWIRALPTTFVLKREWLASFEKCDEGLVLFDDGHICHMKEICTARIKLSDEMVKE